ncbi:MAG: DsbC family protein [Pseudomonadota bacterium]
MRTTLGLALLALGCSGLASADEGAIRNAFPNTNIDSVDCALTSPLCEVVAGKSVFYTTPDARLMVIGRVFDLQLGRSITDDRLDALDAKYGVSDTSSAPRAAPSSLANGLSGTFDPADAIVTGEGARHVSIIADPACPYCAGLAESVVALGDVEASVYLVGSVGGRAVPETVYCASDPETALYQAYTRNLKPGPSCERAMAVARNERAARTLGLSGTPILIRDDGAIRYGMLGPSDLDAWLKGGK